jgi:hypothetical protein
MSQLIESVCPECNETVERGQAVDRRDFLRTLGVGSAAVAAGTVLPAVAPSLWPALAAQAQTPAPAPVAAAASAQAEVLVRELWTSLTRDQLRSVYKPWDHRSASMLTRHRMVNQAIDRRLGQVYTRPQRELLQRIVRALCSDDAGYDRICRRENSRTAWDQEGQFEWCGADFFGKVSDDLKWAFVLSGHHITMRCGNTETDRAFGGPIYYGHSPDGYSRRNVFYFQTQAVLSVFDALTEQQRSQAIVVGTPGEQAASVRLRTSREAKPGIPAAELSHSQRLLIHSVMREVVSPFRTEDQDRVMDIVSRNGGLDNVHLAFYRDRAATDNSRWHFWRLEGPGFVWNYRVLPHVHTYVNVATPPQA